MINKKLMCKRRHRTILSLSSTAVTTDLRSMKRILPLSFANRKLTAVGIKKNNVNDNLSLQEDVIEFQFYVFILSTCFIYVFCVCHVFYTYIIHMRHTQSDISHLFHTKLWFLIN